jgi:hypothetical protein
MLPSTQNKMKAIDSVFYDNFLRLRSSEKEEEDTIDDEIKRFYNEDEEESDFNEVFNEEYCEYPGLKLLNTLDLEIENVEAKIHICAFHINSSGMNPFLQYFLRKIPKNDSSHPDNFTFPTFNYEDAIDPVIRAEMILELLMYVYKNRANFVYEGFFCDATKSNYFLFFNCGDQEIGVHDLYRDNEMWLLTMDEIINTRKVCGNFSVAEEVTQFFEENPDFIFLKDKNSNNYEIPVIAYIGTTVEQSNYISTFGNGKSDEKNKFGANYYFYDYTTAATMSFANETSNESLNKDSNFKPITIMNWLTSKSKDVNLYSVIRFALFMGKTHVINNSPKDPSDNSQTTQEMLREDTTCATLSHRELINYLRISDRGSLWTEEYDSVFLAAGVELDDETVVNHTNTYVVKNYEQQLAISCHFLELTDNDNKLYFIR